MEKVNPADYKTIIQCTSIGLKKRDPCPFDTDKLSKDQYAVDMIYKNTEFLTKAAARGCKTVDGKGMLLHQGVKAWEIWTGIKAPVEEMRKALENALS